MKDKHYTNIGLTPKQRSKLEYFQRLHNKSMNQLICEAIDEKYPDPQEPRITQILSNTAKPDTVKENYEEDINSLASGLSEDVYLRLFRK
jgi:hypothetical protein